MKRIQTIGWAQLTVAAALAFGVTAGDLLAQPGRGRETDQPRRQIDRQPGQFQPGGGRLGGMQDRFAELFKPSFTSADLEQLVDRVGLREDQAAAADALFQTYLEQFNAAAEIWRGEIEAVREQMRRDRDMSRTREIPAMMLTWRAERSKMARSFQEDVQLLLDERQQSRWTDWERAYRRSQALPEGRLAGEQVNLIELVEEMDLSLEESSDLLELLGEYEVDLDRALRARDAALPEIEQELAEALQAEDVDLALGAHEAAQELRRAVQEVNRRYASRCEAVLPTEHQAAFDRKVREMSYPQVFRPTRLETAFPAALKLDTVDADQQATIASLQERYMQELQASRERQIELIDAAEASDEPRWLERLRAREESGDDIEDRRDRRRFDPENMPEEWRVRMELRELERETLRHLREALTEEQIEQLRESLGMDERGFEEGRPGRRDRLERRGPGREGRGG